MKKSHLILQNNKQETARVMPYTGEQMSLVYRHDQKRIEVVRDVADFEENEISYDLIHTFDKSIEGDVVAKGSWGQLKHVATVERTVADTKERQENNRDFFFFLKWTAAIQTSVLVLALLVSFITNKFFSEPEAQVVKVFKREDMKLPAPVVAMSKKKIDRVKLDQVFRKKTTTNKTKKVAVRNSGKVQNNSLRSGNDLSQMGALSAFGGMNKNSKGLGGLSNSPSKSAGYGFDSTRARGGSARGMLGKGLIQAGIGGGETLQGYGGYGTSGKGQGQAGYGVLGMAGRAGGYYLPMSEDAVIEGGLDPDQINAVIFRNEGQIRYCFENALQVTPNLSGRVNVKFVISPHGAVSVANVAHTSLDSKKVESCLIGKLRGFKFPKPKGNVSVKVSYPFMFKRNS
jgi:hypothetical protein